MLGAVINLAYLLGALAFVLGLRRLSSPDTAKRGNRLAAIGMGIAIVATLLTPGGNGTLIWILSAMLIGALIGWRAATKVEMTAMPQLVSIFNGLGGASAVVLGGLELYRIVGGAQSVSTNEILILLLTLFIGGVAFTGSILAYLKLDGKVWDETITLPRHSLINGIFLLGLVAFMAYLCLFPAQLTTGVLVLFTVLTLIYGLSFVAPIGGADMPVVISLLNSFTGLSAAAAGLIYGNQIMLVGGILVGASGTILTVLMCNAMNRSLFNVLIGGFSASGGASKTASGDQNVIEVGLSDLAIQMYYSKKVMVVPGYGLAVAQAQKACKELDELLEANQVEVKYAIHPVAGRMPGHMNVLLAEVDIPYNKLLDLEEANAEFKDTDVVIVVGANDVVNPSAEDDPGSSIYGMPVLQVWNAKQVIVLKRSMRPGYAGIQNPLFFHEKTKMLFGDAKDSLQKLVSEVKNQ
ncbi:NAD(P)(+) transhydrogenase (Re/Si-specific) subunit beta [Lewinella cohaerens]|uniref:NAD(P)(+) transhydrogenase (Re/Si-specific) subunit beta n=1 Tax=Lewinella cohaerens TaxID=70995 RepID=UPI00037DFBCB|nr:NAD(P)(+) transhydrogenase (Re/Si-specific) subunit beta [Lewinella cohaerens]